MSTARFNTLQNAAGSKSVPVDTVVDGSAKAWVNYNGTGTVAIRRAFNVSSITDNGTGDYTINFTNPMPDANYSVGCHAPSQAGNDINRYLMVHGTSGLPTLQTTTSLRVIHGYANIPSDCNAAYVSIFR